MSSINVNDGSINFGTKSLNEFSDAENLSDFTHVLALKQDGNIGVRMAIDNFLNKLSQEGGFATLEDLGNKQNTLISGTNIKTINGVNILSSGDLVVGNGLVIDDINPSLTKVYSSTKCEQAFGKIRQNVYVTLEPKYSTKALENELWLKSSGQWNKKSDYPELWERITGSTNLYAFYNYNATNGLVGTKRETPRLGDFVYQMTNQNIGGIQYRIGDVRGTVIGISYSVSDMYIKVEDITGSITSNYQLRRSPSYDLSTQAYPHKTSSESYTDYDLVINETDNTFRLPTKPLPRVLVETGSNSLFNWEIYSDGYCRLRGTSGRSATGYETINLPLNLKGILIEQIY